MKEFVANFQKKHGQQVPMPKIYGDEDTSDDEGPELADGTKAAKKKTTGGAGGSGGGKPHKKPAAGGRSSGAGGTGGGDGASTSGGSGPSTSGGGGVGDLEVESKAGTTTVVMMTLTNAGRQGVGMHHQSQWWLARSHARRAQVTPRSTESCQSSTSLGRRREPCWVTAYWTGLMSKRGRYTRRGCRGDK